MREGLGTRLEGTGLRVHINKKKDPAGSVKHKINLVWPYTISYDKRCEKHAGSKII